MAKYKLSLHICDNSGTKEYFMTFSALCFCEGNGGGWCWQRLSKHSRFKPIENHRERKLTFELRLSLALQDWVRWSSRELLRRVLAKLAPHRRLLGSRLLFSEPYVRSDRCSGALEVIRGVHRLLVFQTLPFRSQLLVLGGQGIALLQAVEVLLAGSLLARHFLVALFLILQRWPSKDEMNLA